MKSSAGLRRLHKHIIFLSFHYDERVSLPSHLYLSDDLRKDLLLFLSSATALAV